MANKDIDRDAVKALDGIAEFSGGMNWVTESSKLPNNACRLLQNVDIRTGDAEKSKGQKPYGKVEIGARYYDRFTTGVSSALWFGEEGGDGIITTNSDDQLSITGVTSSHAWDTVGLVSKTLSPKTTLGYIEFTVKTPAVLASTSRFRVGLAASETALDTDTGLQIEFDESGDIIRRETTSETDTTVNWAVATTYRIRIEKQATGWLGYLVDVTNAPQTAVSLFDTSFEGTANNFLEFQVYGSEWIIDDVVYHDGFGPTAARKSPTGVVRYYRESGANEIIVFAHGQMYKFDYANGYTNLKGGMNDEAKIKHRVFNDELIIVNGIDPNIVYNGANVQGLGSGATISPVADAIEVHLQSVFLLKGNSLYRNDAGNVLSWDALSPVVDLDAWNGDKGVDLIKLGTNLYIIKESSVWELTGTTNANFTLRRILGARGCIAPHSVATNGIVAFWRGVDGVYRFNGTRTSLISYPVHPAFSPYERAEFSTTMFSKAADSVGVIHNYKYRLACVQNGEADTDINNFEWVYDMLAGNGQGGWTQRTSRNVSMYSVFDGAGDQNELLYVSSDTKNDLYIGEIDDGILYNDYSNITVLDKADTAFVGRVLSRRNVGQGSARDFLNKNWNGHRVYFEPRGDHYLGLKVFTKYNTQGSLLIFQIRSSMNNNTMNGSNLIMDDTQPLMDGFVQENTILLKYDAQSNQTKGTEMWWEVTQATEVRTKKLAADALEDPVPTSTYTGLLASPGNFEPFSIKRVVLQFTEDNN